MRRPSPLPPPPVAPPVVRPDRDEPPRVPGAHTDDERIARTRRPVAPPDADVVDPPSSSPDGPAAPIRVRDVWRAARARRRALRAEVRRFTVRQRRRRLVWIGAAASLVLLVLVTLGAAYSPLLAVEKISVVGTSQLDAASVESALATQIGTPLPLVSESDVKAALIGFPLVETYSLEARPPHELVVRIVERTPIGVMETRAGYTVVDAAGVALSTTPTAPAGQPVLDITGGAKSAAFRAAGTVMRSLPDDIRAQVTAVTASTADDVTITLGGTNTQIMWGSADESAMKAVALAATMKARPPSTVSSYDVSSPEAVVVG
ncbi:FtsQ-type POTRA domain-containing protein [Microbacterium sp. P01]|uniref:FtsQ-type POTRA domain-containing protein n=1 Tax=Microbacterium sp. P01 TaxID=3366261 RepID=UPI00366C2339